MEQKQYTTEEKLRIIAEALNKKTGQTIDFNKYQERYYLAYDYNSKFIMQLYIFLRESPSLPEKGPLYFNDFQADWQSPDLRPEPRLRRAAGCR